MTSLFLIALLIGGPQVKPSPTPRPKPSAPPVLEGRVLGPDGKPIEGALVVARPENASWFESPITKRTDRLGQFSALLPRRGTYQVRVEAPGLAAATLERVALGRPLTITLKQGTWIAGMVRDAGGAPVSGALVEARGLSNWGQAPPWEPNAGRTLTRTDPKGRFRLEGLGPGSHQIAASARGVGRAQRAAVPPRSEVELFLWPAGSISGVVVDARGQPAAEAVVRAEMQAAGPGIARCDSQGRFELPGLEPGDYTLLARLGDTVAISDVIRIDPDTIWTETLRLEPGGAVAGRLVDGDQRPVAGRVRIQEVGGRETPRALDDLLRAGADAQGRFRIEHLPPGSHSLAISAAGFAPARADFDARSGVETDVGEIELVPGLTIRGRVTDRAKAGIEGAHVSGWQRDSHVEAYSGYDGAYALAGLKPGNYRLSAAAAGYADARRNVAAADASVDFVLDVAGSISGEVVDESGRPLESFTITAQGSAGAMLTMDSTGPVAKAFAAVDGRFELPDVKPGRYVISAEAPQRETGSVSGVEVKAGVVTPAGRIRLGPGGELRGSVVQEDGTPIPGAQVQVSTQREYQMKIGPDPQADTDANGRFSLRGLSPGVTDAFALHPGFATATLRAMEIEPENGPTEVRFRMSQGGRVEGTVRKRDGTPPADSVVTVRPMGPSGDGVPWTGWRRKPVDADGTFAMDRVPPGPAQVHLLTGRNGRYTGRQARDVEVREGETARVDFSFREILVSGRVMRGDQPAAGVRVEFQGRGGTMSMFVGAAPVVDAASAGPQLGWAITGSDGGYQLLTDQTGSHGVQVRTPDSTGEPAFRQVDIPDSDSFEYDITIGDFVAIGVVTDRESGAAIPNADVWAISSDRDWSRSGQGRTDDAGRFKLELVRGSYRFSARAEGYASGTVDVEVTESSPAGLRIELDKGLSLSGRLVDEAGRPAGGVMLTATAGVRGTASWDNALSLPDGTFRFASLASRPYSILAGGPLLGYAFRAVAEPGEADLLLTLRPAGTLMLTVRLTDGSPVSGEWPELLRLDGIDVAGPTMPSTLDERGAAELRLPAGSVEVEVQTRTHSGRTVVTLSEGREAAAELVLAERPAKP